MLSIDEDARKRFEADWLSGRSQSIRSYLPEANKETYLGTLEELVCIDLEFRWRPGNNLISNSNHTVSVDQASVQTRVEDYIREFPELNQTDIVQRLVEQEIHVRLNAGFVVEPSEFHSRFPEVTIDESMFTEPGDGETVVQHGMPQTTAKTPIMFPQAFGKYELLGLLGRGGMGSVYRAKQEAAGREVALKIAELDNMSAQGRALMTERFHTEALTAATVAHDHIVTVYDVGTQDGQPYIAMQLVEGGDLNGMSKAEPFQPKRAAKYILGIAEALDEAHRKGMLHRDIKPGNILLEERTDRALLTDFGLARFCEDDSGMTQTGQLLGTPSFMPPEQIKNSSKIDGRADLYALGGTLYQLLTGKPPFKAADMHETLRQVMSEDAVSPRTLNSAIDRDIETVCLKCLEKEANARYQTAADLATDLKLYLEGKPILSRPAGPAKRWIKWCRRNKALALAEGLAVSAAMLAIIATSVGWIRTDTLWRNAEDHRKKAVLAREEYQTSVRELYVRFRDEPILSIPGLEHFKQDFLEQTKDRFERFILAFQEDEDLQEDRAFALAAIAEMNADLKLPEDQVRSSVLQALDAIESLNSELREKPSIWEAESNMQLALGKLMMKSGKLQEAEEHFNASCSLRAAWLKAEPENPEASRKYANAIMNQGVVHLELARSFAMEEKAALANEHLGISEGKFLDAQSLRFKLLEENAALTRVKRDSAKAEFNLGYLELNKGDLAEAVRHLDKASQLFGELANEILNDGQLWKEYARARISQADLSAATPSYPLDEDLQKKTAKLLKAALGDLASLIQLRNRHPDYQLSLLQEYQRGLDALISMNHLDLAEDLLAEFERLVESTSFSLTETVLDEADSHPIQLYLNFLKHEALLGEGLDPRDLAIEKVTLALKAFERCESQFVGDPKFASDRQFLQQALQAIQQRQ